MKNGPALLPGPFSNAPCLCLAARNRHVLAVVVMVVMVMVAPIVVMMVVMVPANDDRTAMVVMMMVMILSNLNAIGTFGGRPLRAGRVVSIQKCYCIRNGR
jgi:hypothetical protein